MKLCARLTSALLLAATAAAAADLREEVKRGTVLRAITTAGPELPGLGPLILQSDVVAVGEVVAERARLSDDGSEVLTDYTVVVREMLARPEPDRVPAVSAGQRITVTRRGGHMQVEGMAVNIVQRQRASDEETTTGIGSSNRMKSKSEGRKER